MDSSTVDNSAALGFTISAHCLITSVVANIPTPSSVAIQRRIKWKIFLRRGWRSSGLKHLAIDEICIGRGRRFRTLVLDLDTGAIVFVGKGKGADALNPFWKRLKASRAKIQAVAADLSPAYTKAVRENLPDAALVLKQA